MSTFLQLLAGSLGWTLLNFCWQAAAIALVYGAIDYAMPRARSQTRYLLSLAAILAMFAASLATLGYEAGRHQLAEHSDPILASRLPDLAVFANLPAPLARRTAPIDLLNLPREAAGDLSAAMPAIMSWIDITWLLGVLCLSARSIGGWWWIQRLRRRASDQAPALVLARFSHVRERLGVRWRVDLRISRDISGPLAIGVLRSFILLPASALLALSPEQMEAVLAHELAHVRRADYFWNLMQTMIETLFFFHPAVWWVGKRLREQRELCCDDAAVGFCADPLLYATALLAMEEQRNPKLDLAMALDGQRPWSGLRARIARLLGEALPAERKRGLTALPLAAFCVGIAILPLLTARLFAGSSSPRTSPPQMPALMQAAAPSIPSVALPAPPTVPAPAPPAEPALPPTPSASPAPAPPARPAPPAAPSATGAPANLPATSQGAEAADLLRGLVRHSEMNPENAQLRALAQATMGNQAAASRMLMLRLKLLHDLSAAEAPDVSSASGSDYIDQMRAAGYDLPPEEYINLKMMGVTPEYARAVQKLGLGGDLIAMKTMGVTPEYLARLRSAGVQIHSFHDVIAYKVFNLSPQEIAKLKTLGFGSMDAHEILMLHAEGVTPEYAAEMRKQFPNLTAGELIQLRIFKIDDAFIAAAKRHNFAPLTVQTLIRLRISGLLDNGANGAAK